MGNAIIDIDELPELETGVAAHGSSEQREVGGEVCIALIVIHPPAGG